MRRCGERKAARRVSASLAGLPAQFPPAAQSHSANHPESSDLSCQSCAAGLARGLRLSCGLGSSAAVFRCPHQEVGQKRLLDSNKGIEIGEKLARKSLDFHGTLFSHSIDGNVESHQFLEMPCFSGCSKERVGSMGQKGLADGRVRTSKCVAKDSVASAINLYINHIVCTERGQDQYI
jgi:hypothetical protein